MARKYMVKTDSGAEYMVEEKGTFRKTWVGLKIKPELWAQEKVILAFTDDKNLISEHKKDPDLTPGKLNKSNTHNHPKGGCAMLFSEGHSTRIHSMHEIKAAA